MSGYTNGEAAADEGTLARLHLRWQARSDLALGIFADYAQIQLAHVPTGGEDPMGQPDYLFPFSPTGANVVMGIEYVHWFQSNGVRGEEPPPKIRQMMELWKAGRSAAPQERIRIGKEIIKIHVDEVFSIGMLTGGLSFYGIHVAKKNLGNVPRRMVNTLNIKNPLNALPMTFYYKNT